MSTPSLVRFAPFLLGGAVFAGVGGAHAQSSRAHGKKTASLSASSPIGGAAVLAYLSGKQALVGSHAPSTRPVTLDDFGRPTLALSTLNRGEFLSVPVSSEGGGFTSADLDRVAHLLRAGGGEEHPIDARTLSIVYRIQTHFDVPEIRVVSGYRVPRPGSHSNHGKGRAIDIVVPGVADEEVARFARTIGFVGVGVYPASEFVHVDIRSRSYFWVDSSGPHMRNRERPIFGDLAVQSDAAAAARGEVPVEPFGVTTDVDGALRARGLTLGTSPSPSPPSPEEDDDEGG